MLILALDTSTRAGSAAVVRGDTVLSLISGDAGRTHAERLPDELDRALTIAGVAPADIGLLAVASGPGGFTGLRIGLAAMQGLAMTLHKPVIGVSTLDALAAAAASDCGDGSRQVGSRESDRHLSRSTSDDSQLAAPDPRPTPDSRFPTPVFIGCWIDAQRGEVFAALYSRSLEVVDPPGVATPAATLERWRAARPLTLVSIVATGDGAVRYADVLASAGIRVLPAPDLAPFIAWLARERAAAGLAGPPHALAPLYVRRPDAEIDRDRRASS